MKTATISALKEQKDRCLHIIEVEKALTRLEANEDYKILSQFLFDEELKQQIQEAYSIVNNPDHAKKAEQFAKSLSRVHDYLSSLHYIAEGCVDEVAHLDNEIVNAEAEE
jgi:hypothetical protein